MFQQIMSLLLHVAVRLLLPLIIAVLSGRGLLNQGLRNIIILKDDMFNANAVLGPMSQLRMDPPSRITEVLVADKDNEDTDFGKIIEARVIVDKMLDTFELAPVDIGAQVVLNDALEPISAFEKRLKAGRIFDLNSSMDESHPFSKSVLYQWMRGNHARAIKEPSAKSKDVCEVLTLHLGPAIQVTRLLAIALMEFETLRPYPRARNADGISLLLNVLLWSVFTVLRIRTTSGKATRGNLLSASRLSCIQGDAVVPVAQEKKPLSSRNFTMTGKSVRVVVFGNKNASVAMPSKATSAIAAAEEDPDFDDGCHEFSGAPEASLS